MTMRKRPAPRAPARPAAATTADDLATVEAFFESRPEATLDAASLDGFLAGLAVQPRPLPRERWWPVAFGADAAAARSLAPVVERRRAELASLVAGRRWFDPWLFVADPGHGEVDGEADVVATVRPWASGFALALESFPALLETEGDELDEALAGLYRHLGTDHLEAAEGLDAAIESLDPPSGLDAAVEELVRSTLLLADIADALR